MILNHHTVSLYDCSCGTSVRMTDMAEMDVSTVPSSATCEDVCFGDCGLSNTGNENGDWV